MLSLQVEIVRMSVFINIEIMLYQSEGQSSKRCLASPGHCQWADLHRQCVTRLDYILSLKP